MDKPNLQEVITAICGHYTAPDGSHPSDLKGITVLPQFQQKYAEALKRANGDGRAATAAALYQMLHVRQAVKELPVHVVATQDHDMSFKDRKFALRTNEDGTPTLGVRIIMPDGVPRYLTGVPAEVQAKLSPGQPVKMVGDITVSEDLGKKVKGLRSKSVRLGKADLKDEAHAEPFPHGGLDLEWHVGRRTRFGEDGKVLPIREWKGGYRLDKRSNTLSLRFGPNESDGRPYDVQCRFAGTVREARYDDYNEGEEVIKLVVEDDVGNKVGTKENPGTIADIFGIRADGDYAPLVGERVLASGYGSIEAMMDVEDFGPSWETELADLRQKGLLVGQKNNASLLQLAFPDKFIDDLDAIAARDGVPAIPHVTIGDKRVVGMHQDRNGAWKVSGLAADFGRNPWFVCRPGEGHRNRTGSLTWLSRVGGKLSYSNDDPLYRDLATIDLSA